MSKAQWFAYKTSYALPRVDQSFFVTRGGGGEKEEEEGEEEEEDDDSGREHE